MTQGEETSGFSKRMKPIIRRGISLVTAIGVFLGVMEYRQRGHMAQAQQTMAMIDVWELRGARKAFRELSWELEKMIEASVSDADREAAREDSRSRNRLRMNLSRRVLADDAQSKNFEEVVYFFTRLSLCIEAELCDADAAKTFFGDTLDSFMLIFRLSIAERRMTHVNFGVPLIDLQSKFGRMG